MSYSQGVGVGRCQSASQKVGMGRCLTGLVNHPLGWGDLRIDMRPEDCLVCKGNEINKINLKNMENTP